MSDKLPEHGRYEGDVYTLIEYNPTYTKKPYTIAVYYWHEYGFDDGKGEWVRKYMDSMHQPGSKDFKTLGKALEYRSKVLLQRDKAWYSHQIVTTMRAETITL